MMVPKLRFSRGLKVKVPGAVSCTCSCSRSDVALVEIFTGPAPIDWTQEETMVKVRIFFCLRGSFKCMIVILPTFWHSAPALKFSWQLTRNVSLATMLVYSYRRSLDEDGRSLWVGTLRPSFTAILRAVWSLFSHQAPPSPISSTSQSPPSFPSPSLSTRRNQLSPRSPSSQKHSNVQLVPACVASGNIHNAVSRHLDKNRATHRTVFSMNKAQESKQRSTNWRRRHLGDMQQQPRRWPGFDKCIETKLRLDVYMRPWPPGWSFLRRIYASRGSERVKFQHFNQDCPGLFQEIKMSWNDYDKSVPSRHSDKSVPSRHSDKSVPSRHSDKSVPSRHSDKSVPSRHSDKSVPSRHSDKSVPSRHSDKSVPSRHSDKSVPSRHSDKSVPSRHSDKSVPSRHSDKSVPSRHSDKSVPSRHSDKSVPSRHSDKSVPSRHSDKSVPSRHSDLNTKSQCLGIFKFSFLDSFFYVNLFVFVWSLSLQVCCLLCCLFLGICRECVASSLCPRTTVNSSTKCPTSGEHCAPPSTPPSLSFSHSNMRKDHSIRNDRDDLFSFFHSLVLSPASFVCLCLCVRQTSPNPDGFFNWRFDKYVLLLFFFFTFLYFLFFGVHFSSLRFQHSLSSFVSEKDGEICLAFIFTSILQ